MTQRSLDHYTSAESPGEFPVGYREKQITWEDGEEWVVVYHHDEHEYREGTKYHCIAIEHVGTMMDLVEDSWALPRPSNSSGIGSFPCRRGMVQEKVDYIIPEWDDFVVIYRCDVDFEGLNEMAAEIIRKDHSLRHRRRRNPDRPR